MERSQEFRKCIECFLCQNTCHVIRDHEENKAAFSGPASSSATPSSTCTPTTPWTARTMVQEDRGLGLCNITKCCTEVCPEHIKITDNGIIPMKERVVDVKYDPIRFLRQAPDPEDRADPARAASSGKRARSAAASRHAAVQPLRAGSPRGARSKDLWCSLECTPACQAGGRGFKSRQVRGRIAQLVERAPEKREVRGSTPGPTTGQRPGHRPGAFFLLAKFRSSCNVRATLDGVPTGPSCPTPFVATTWGRLFGDHLGQAIGDPPVPFLGGVLIDHGGAGLEWPRRAISSLVVAPVWAARVPAACRSP